MKTIWQFGRENNIILSVFIIATLTCSFIADAATTQRPAVVAAAVASIPVAPIAPAVVTATANIDNILQSWTAGSSPYFAIHARETGYAACSGMAYRYIFRDGKFAPVLITYSPILDKEYDANKEDDFKNTDDYCAAFTKKIIFEELPKKS